MAADMDRSINFGTFDVTGGSPVQVSLVPATSAEVALAAGEDVCGDSGAGGDSAAADSCDEETEEPAARSAAARCTSAVRSASISTLPRKGESAAGADGGGDSDRHFSRSLDAVSDTLASAVRSASISTPSRRGESAAGAGGGGDSDRHFSRSLDAFSDTLAIRGDADVGSKIDGVLDAMLSVLSARAGGVMNVGMSAGRGEASLALFAPLRAVSAAGLSTTFLRSAEGPGETSLASGDER